MAMKIEPTVCRNPRAIFEPRERLAEIAEDCPNRGETRRPRARSDADADGVIETSEAEAAAEESAETVVELMDAGDNPAIEAVVEEEVFEVLSEGEKV